jgi:hypothetical protein
MARGRLIFPFLVDIAQVDTVATAAVTDGGYDDVFREPIMVPPVSGSGRGTISREEVTYTYKCQIEPDTFQALDSMISGKSPNSEITIVMHYKDLELDGLVDSSGKPLLRTGDRMAQIRHYRTGAVIEEIPSSPGLYVVQVRSEGFGLSSLARNLLFVTFKERELSTRTSG